MVEILFLLLPIAFYSGWRAARKHFFKEQQQQCQLSDQFVTGVNYLLSEQPDKALEVFLNYPDIDEYTVETYQLLGNMFRSRGEVDRALKVHQNLIARSNLNPDQKETAMFSLGEDFLAAGMLDRAESVFQELLDNPSSNKTVSKAVVCSSLRNIYEQTREWQKAIEATDCVNKHNNNKYTQKNSGDAKTDNNRYDNKVLIAHYYCELADEALHQGNLHEVEKLMKKAQAVHKKSTRLMTLQGDVTFHQKHYMKSIKHYLSAIKQDSRLLSMLFNKLETAANKSENMPFLQDELLKLYKKKKESSVFEVIVKLANQYASSDKIDALIESEMTTKKLNIESIHKVTDYLNNKQGSLNLEKGLLLTHQSLDNYLKGLPRFSCEHCGYKLHDYLWRCPACQQWDTIVSE